MSRLGQGNNFGFMPYGLEWRRYRRHFWQHFTSRAVEGYQSVQRAAALQFLARVVERPSGLRDHIRWWAISSWQVVRVSDSNSVCSTFLAIVLKVVYGVGLAEDHDKYAETFNVSAEGVAQGLVPGKYIVDVLPFLKDVPKWVPGFGWQADFERWRAAVHQVKNVPFAHTKEAMVSRSSSIPCTVCHWA